MKEELTGYLERLSARYDLGCGSVFVEVYKLIEMRGSSNEYAIL